MEKHSEMTIYEKNAMKRMRMLIDNYCDGSQQRFSEMCHLNKASVSQYVNGKNVPSSITAAKIAKVFNVDPAWLMGFDISSGAKDELNNSSDMPLLKEKQLSSEETELLRIYRSLNDEGREKISDYARLLSRDGSYIKNNEFNVVEKDS